MKTRRMVTLALMVALSVGLHYLESLIPELLPIPGFRLGLANIITLFVLYYYGGLSYLFVTACKVLLVALISTGFGVPFFMSLCGSTFSAIVSLSLYYLVKPSIYSLSPAAAIAHTLGQLLVYALFFDTFFIFSYFVILGPLSLLSGVIMALLVKVLVTRLPRQFKVEELKRRH